jgi:hypothetical protein
MPAKTGKTPSKKGATKAKPEELSVFITRQDGATFKYTIKEDWGYKIRLETPTKWGQETNSDYNYAAKFAAALFVGTMGIESNVMHLVGRFNQPMTPEEIEASTIRRGFPPTWKWRKVIDPANKVRVREAPAARAGRRVWEIDFSRVVRTKTLNLDKIRKIAEARGFEVA